MNIKEISEKLGLSFLNEAEPSKEVEGGYCGDLLSFVMSHAKCGDCWFTVMGNVNAVAVAVLSDCAAIVLCLTVTRSKRLKSRVLTSSLRQRMHFHYPPSFPVCYDYKGRFTHAHLSVAVRRR